MIAHVLSTKLEGVFRKIKTVWGDDNAENIHQSTPFGIDSNPIRGVFGLQITVLGKTYVIGYVQKAIQDLDKGETAIYSKDSQGQVSSKVIARNDGNLELLGTGDFMVRYNELATQFNELKTAFNAHIATYNSFVGIVNSHTHTYAPGPLPPVQSGVPSATGTTSTTSNADITQAKHEEIKTTPKPTDLI